MEVVSDLQSSGSHSSDFGKCSFGSGVIMKSAMMGENKTSRRSITPLEYAKGPSLGYTGCAEHNQKNVET